MQTSDPACQAERVIPASRRPDGSMRKPIRIRAGFRSDGDYVPFKPRVIQERDTAAAIALEQSRLRDARLKEELERLELKQQQHKVRRKRNKNKKKSEPDVVDNVIDEIATKLEEVSIENNIVEIDPIALGKKLRNLRKRLAKANELQARYEAGEQLSQEEFEKVYKREDMQQNIVRIQEQILMCSKM